MSAGQVGWFQTKGRDVRAFHRVRPPRQEASLPETVELALDVPQSHFRRPTCSEAQTFRRVSELQIAGET